MRRELREELAAELYASKITVTKVAKILKLTREQTSRILNGKSGTTFDNWEKIAKLVKKRFVLEDVD